MSFTFDTIVYGLEVKVTGDFERPADDAPLAFMIDTVTHYDCEIDVSEFPAELHDRLNKEADTRAEEEETDYE